MNEDDTTKAAVCGNCRFFDLSGTPFNSGCGECQLVVPVDMSHEIKSYGWNTDKWTVPAYSCWFFERKEVSK